MKPFLFALFAFVSSASADTLCILKTTHPTISPKPTTAFVYVGEHSMKGGWLSVIRQEEDSKERHSKIFVGGVIEAWGDKSFFDWQIYRSSIDWNKRPQRIDKLAEGKILGAGKAVAEYEGNVTEIDCRRGDILDIVSTMTLKCDLDANVVRTKKNIFGAWRDLETLDMNLFSEARFDLSAEKPAVFRREIKGPPTLKVSMYASTTPYGIASFVVDASEDDRVIGKTLFLSDFFEQGSQTFSADNLRIDAGQRGKREKFELRAMTMRCSLE